MLAPHPSTPRTATRSATANALRCLRPRLPKTRLPRDQVEQYHIAGLVHDVGKIGVPETVLTKAGRLTAEEFEQMKRHPEIGYGILKDIPSMRTALPGVLHHHQRWDGNGYPRRLAATRSPSSAGYSHWPTPSTP